MRWIKLYINESLRGSIRFDLSMEEQGIWFNLLLLAGDSRSPGVIQAAPGTSYPIVFVAAQLRITPKLLDRTLKKLAEQKRIEIARDGISIINWEKYQTVKEPASKRLQPSDNPPAPPVQPTTPGRTAPPQPQSPMPSSVPKRRPAPTPTN